MFADRASRTIVTSFIAIGFLALIVVHYTASEAPADTDATTAGELKFVNSTPVMVVPGPRAGDVTMYKWMARLSDNGRYLLYVRRVERTIRIRVRGVSAVRSAFRLVLRDLKNGGEKVLPGMPINIAHEYIGLFMSMRIFNAAGTKIAVPCGIDTDGDGWCTIRKDKMCLGIYDIATDSLKQRELRGEAILPTFDRTGRKLLVMAFENVFRNTGKLYVGSGDGTGLKELKVSGMPLGLCPAADAAPLYRIDEKWIRTLVLYDLTRNAKIADLPIYKHNGLLKRVGAHWTRDGRYLCYVDTEPNVKDKSADAKRMVRIWDRKTGKVIRTLDNVIPTAPGTTPTTIIVESAPDGGKSYQLHDVATGKSRPIEKCLRIISTSGGKIVYTTAEPKRKETIYIGELQLPGHKDGRAVKLADS